MWFLTQMLFHRFLYKIIWPTGFHDMPPMELRFIIVPACLEESQYIQIRCSPFPNKMRKQISWINIIVTKNCVLNISLDYFLLEKWKIRIRLFLFIALYCLSDPRGPCMRACSFDPIAASLDNALWKQSDSRDRQSRYNRRRHSELTEEFV